MQCGRCQGRGEIDPFGIGSHTCPVCLGLGSYETNPDIEKPPPNQHHFVVVHSSVKIEDVIAMLPTRSNNDREE